MTGVVKDTVIKLVWSGARPGRRKTHGRAITDERPSTFTWPTATNTSAGICRALRWRGCSSRRENHFFLEVRPFARLGRVAGLPPVELNDGGPRRITHDRILDDALALGTPCAPTRALRSSHPRCVTRLRPALGAAAPRRRSTPAIVRAHRRPVRSIPTDQRQGDWLAPGTATMLGRRIRNPRARLAVRGRAVQNAHRPTPWNRLDHRTGDARPRGQLMTRPRGCGRPSAGDHHLRHSKFIALREDKKAREVRRE